jgi:two-component system invasion response regulator UvrY
MMKILVADDHPVVREGLKQILLGVPDKIMVHEASTSHEVLNKVWKSDYDVILLDISLPDRSGLETLRELKRAKPDLRVLVITIHPEEQYAVRAIRAGASGYLTKESAPDELVVAIRTLSQGRKYISPSLAERLAFALEVDAEKMLHEALSDREYQVMCMIASGKPLTEIAGDLMLSVKTISTYRSRILGKMRMKSNAELTRYAMKHGLVD